MPRNLQSHRPAALVILVAGMVTVGCSADRPVGAEIDSTGDHALASVLTPDLVAQTLNDLRRKTAAWHNLSKAEAAGYTTPLGCIDERVVQGVDPAIARGMGFHPANLDLLFDDAVDLLNPETLVYGRVPGSGQMRLAAFDYFVPASAAWPSPDDGGSPPVLPEIGIPYTWSAIHGGWMFHIWLWWDNPDGMFANWNPTVPLCECQLDPNTGTCTPG